MRPSPSKTKDKEKKIYAVSSTIQPSFLKSRCLGLINVITIVGSVYMNNYLSTGYKESILWEVTYNIWVTDIKIEFILYRYVYH